jgi:hypothetical protein
MQLCDIYLGLGQSTFRDLLKNISLGKLRTYQLFERIKLRLRVVKLNSESLFKSAPRQWARLADERDEDLAMDLSQAILVSHVDTLIVPVLNFLGVPHTEGFFEKDADIAEHLTGDWQQRVWSEFEGKLPASVLIFYLNHLAMEMTKGAEFFLPAGVAVGQDFK